MTPAVADDLANRFRYHPPRNVADQENHATIRVRLLEVARDFEDRLPDGREKSCVLTKLEEAMFWANAALARNREGNGA